MENRYIVRNYCDTPKNRINKNKTNIFYFVIYDTIDKSIASTIFGASKEDIKNKINDAENRIKAQTFTKTNSKVSDAAALLLAKEKGKFDNKVIKETSYKGTIRCWNLIKELEFNNVKLQHTLIKNIDVDYLSLLSDQFLIKLSIRDNKNCWSTIGNILNMAAKHKLGVPMFLTKLVDRSEFRAAKKREKKKTPDIFKGLDPEQVLLPTLKNALNYSRLETSYSPGYFLGNYWYAFMVTMAMFNGRISEVLPLTFNDYSTKLHCFYVNKTTDIKTNITTESTKNVSSEDVVYCGEMFTNKVFLPWKKEMENWKYKNYKQLLFPSREGTTKQHGRVLKSVKKIFKDSGFEGNITLHDFRSFGAVIRGFLGIPAQKHLRHSSESMTKLYERGKKWQQNEVANKYSDEVATILLS